MTRTCMSCKIDYDATYMLAGRLQRQLHVAMAAPGGKKTAFTDLLDKLPRVSGSRQEKN